MSDLIFPRQSKQTGEEALDGSLARGYATEFINGLRDLGCITDWLESPRSKAAVEKFTESVGAKKPGRVLTRMAKHLQPPFAGPKIGCWDRELKAVFTGRMVSALETEVFDMASDEQAIFSERSVFLADLLYLGQSDECSSNINVAANVSHHTIKRMLERGASTPDSLKDDVRGILMNARALRQFLTSGIEHELIGLQNGITYDLVLPFCNGGLILRTLCVNPSIKSFFPSPMPVFSIRTFLDSTMVTPRQRERMAEFRLSKEARVSTDDSRHTMRWIKGNAEVAKALNNHEWQ